MKVVVLAFLPFAVANVRSLRGLTAAPTPTARLIGAGCCRPFKVILNATHDPLARTDCKQKCLDHPACNAFAISGCSFSADEACGAGCHIYQLDREEAAFASACHESNGFAGITSNTFCYALATTVDDLRVGGTTTTVDDDLRVGGTTTTFAADSP